MNPITDLVEQLDLATPWTYIGLFLAASLVMIWRLDAMGKSGLEGTALGTVIMPFCSGLGNLFFVWIVQADGLPPAEIVTNSLVNNVTNLTLLMGAPALLFGLSFGQKAKGKSPGRKRASKRASGTSHNAVTAVRLNQLSLLFTLVAGLFFAGAAWVLSQDGVLSATDGIVLCGGFVFWICVQVFDVMKYNVHRSRTIPASFYLDLLGVILAALVLYTAIDWLVEWLGQLQSSGGGAGTLGWLSGLLMVVPNGLIAFYYAAKGQGEVVYASQVGDGHICIPLCLGLAALIKPVTVPSSFELGLGLIVGALVVHVLAVLCFRGLPRAAGCLLVAAYVWFLISGFAG
ncbi:MAG TPA: sodium:calcium symporter [Opitutaceae bacterium]|nr:sodium:calcium symporter [Opitutaceae bacterium]